MDAQQLRQNWNEIKPALQAKFPDASQAFNSTPSDLDSLVASISQHSNRTEAEVRREVESVTQRYDKS